MPTVGIVGAGFSGVAVAWRLLNRMAGPARICLINKGGQVGHGLAYGTPSPYHLLNVPAGRMGIDPDQEGDFVDYLQSMGLPFQPSHFVPRSLYGAYLEQSLGKARVVASARGVRLDIIDGTVVGIENIEETRKHILLDTGESLAADAVVLALGNFPSRPPIDQPDLTWQEPGLHVSPWLSKGFAIDDHNAPVLLLGSGLTAFDVLLQLRHRGHRGPVTMLSRRGLLAQSHRPLESPPPGDIVPRDVLEGVQSIRQMLRTIRSLVHGAEAAGHDWRDVIGGLRPHTPRLWQQLPRAERSRFLRHLAPYWDTHRHRAAVPISRVIEAGLADGSVKVVAGRLNRLHRSENGWEAEFTPRFHARSTRLQVSMVVNCTGPSADLTRQEDGLIRSLLAAGRVTPDPLRLGIEVDGQYRIVDANSGSGRPGFYYVGPLLKASLWEATAVPELRQHAIRLADMVATALEKRAG